MSTEREGGEDQGRNEVWASIGMTKNIGNYESVRIDAGVRLAVGEDPIGEVYGQAWDLVDKQIEGKLIELNESLGGK